MELLIFLPGTAITQRSADDHTREERVQRERGASIRHAKLSHLPIPDTFCQEPMLCLNQRREESTGRGAA